MILGRGTAQTYEAITSEYSLFLETCGHIKSPRRLKNLREVPAIFARRINKPIAQWSDEDIFALYEGKAKATGIRYNVFVSFLLFRGYRRASLRLLTTLPIRLGGQWERAALPYQERLQQTTSELGYACKSDAGDGKTLDLLLWLLTVRGKLLEEITRSDFDQFRDEYHQWYRQEKRRKDGRPDPRLYRLERYLTHWGIIAPAKPVARHEQRFAHLEHQAFRHAVTRYLQWQEAKFSLSTLNSHRTALLTFFQWVREHYPAISRLDSVSREMSLAYAQYLKDQVEAGRYAKGYRNDLYNCVRLFFDFVIDERLDTSPDRNPFSSRDLPKKPDMIARYLPDQDLKKVLEYCERAGTLFEKTMVTVLLHTGIRAMEFAQLRASDIVQIGGVWKLHIHEGIGLKDRLIPLTPQCLAALQAWQEQKWERINDYLFTRYGRPWKTNSAITLAVEQLGRKAGIVGLTAHRFRHTFAVALLNYGLRESALQKLMGHATLGMTLEYARILDETVEKAFGEAVGQMQQDGVHSWVPNFFVQEDYTLFVEGDAVSWIRLPLGYCRRNAKLHCESDVKCLLCDRFAIGKEDLPRLQQMYERFLSLGLKVKAEVVAAQIHRLELPSGETSGGFIPATTISVTRKRQ